MVQTSTTDDAAGQGAGSVAVAGLGNMGSALARAFLEGGLATTVWNRSPQKADPLIAAGATLAPTIADVFSSNATIVVCVRDYDAVHELLDASSGLHAGRTLVNLSSGIPADARKMADRAEQAGMAYLDGSILAIPPLVGQPDALLLYGGSASAFETTEPLLSKLGTSVYIGAEAGTVPLNELALLSAMWSMLFGVMHAVALVGTENISAVKFTPLVTGFLGGMLASLPGMAEEIDAGDYSQAVSTLELNTAGLEVLTTMSREQGISSELPAVMRELAARAVAQGHGADSMASVIEQLRTPTT